MKRHPGLVAALLLLPAVSWAQPARSAADATDVETPPPGYQVKGVSPNLLKDYLAAVQAVDASFDFETTGATRTEMKTDHLAIESTWRSNGQPGQSATLVGMTIRPEAEYVRQIRALGVGPGNRTVQIPGRGAVQTSEITHHADGTIELEVSGLNYKIRPDGECTRGWSTIVGPQRIAGKIEEVTINDRGHAHLKIDGMPDVTITGMTRDAEGNLRLKTSGLVPDIHVRASDGKAYVNFLGQHEVGNLAMLLKMKTWPPQLKDIPEMFGPGATTQKGPPVSGVVTYDIRGTAKGEGLPLPGGLGRVNGEGKIATRGMVRLDPDGTITSLGDGGTMELEMRVGARNFTNPQLNAGQVDGNVSYRGRYRLRIPQGDQLKTNLVVDGDVSWALEGKKLIMNLPTGPRVEAGSAALSGSGKVRAHLVGGAGSVTVRDGVYHLGLTGPVGIEGLRLPGLVASGLQGDGNLTSNGAFAVEGDKVMAKGDLRGRVTPKRGTIQVLNNEGAPLASGSIGEGTTVDLDLDEVSIGGTPVAEPNALPHVGSGAVRGRVAADVRMDELTINDPRLAANGGSARVKVNGTLDGDVQRGARPGGSFNGTAEISGDLANVDAKLSDGRLTAGRLHIDGTTTIAASSSGIDLTNGTLKARLDQAGAIETGLPGTPVLNGAAVRAGSPRTGVVHVSESGLRLRSSANKDTLDNVIGKVTNEAPVTILSTQGDWHEVKLADGRRGFVSAAYVVENPAARAPVTPVTPAPTGPRGRVRTTIEAGSEAEVALDRLHIEKGKPITGAGRIVSAKVLLGPVDLRAGAFEAKLLGSARVALQNAPFEIGANGVKLPRKVSVPVRADLGVGSKVALHMPGKETDVTIDKAGSYIEFTAQVTSDENGVRLDELTNVDLKLVTTAAAKLMGDTATLRGEKSLEFKGRIKLVQGGMDMYGDLAVRVRGDDRTPILSVRF